MTELQKQETAKILTKLSLLSNNDLILEELNPNYIEYLLKNTLFSFNDIINNQRLNIICSIIYKQFIKIDWKRKIITIITNDDWLMYNYIQKLNACSEHIPECKEELYSIYINLIKQERLIPHRQVTIYNNNIHSTCCCGSLDCCIVQLFDNIHNITLFKL